MKEVLIAAKLLHRPMRHEEAELSPETEKQRKRPAPVISSANSLFAAAKSYRRSCFVVRIHGGPPLDSLHLALPTSADRNQGSRISWFRIGENGPFFSFNNFQLSEFITRSQ